MPKRNAVEKENEAFELESEELDEDDEDDEDDESAEVPASPIKKPVERPTEKPVSVRPRVAKAKMVQEGEIPRRRDVKFWRCRRLLNDGHHERLFFGRAGLEVSEWPIKELSIATIRTRWGAGSFVVEFYGLSEDGKKRPLGNSRVLRLIEEPAPAPLPPPPQPAAPPNAFSEMPAVMQILAFLEERAERARASARAEMQMLLERHRTDTELTIERERLASKERLAQFEAMQRQITAPSGQSEVLERLEDVAARLDEIDTKPPQDGTAAILGQAAQLVGPLVMAFASKLSGPGTPTTPPHALN